MSDETNPMLEDDAAALRSALEAERVARRRAQTEQALLVRAAEQTPMFLCIQRGPDHVYAFTNDAYQAIIGRRDVLGKPVREALPELEGQGIFSILDEVYRTGEPFEGRELPVDLLFDGRIETRYFTFVYQPILDADGRVEGVVTTGSDVTGEVLAKREASELNRALAQRSHLVEVQVAERTRELEAAQATLRGVLDSATSGIVACEAMRDAEGTIRDFRFTLANPMSEKMLFHTIDEMVGNTLLTLFPGNVESGLFDRYVQVTETGEPMETQVFYQDERLEFWLNVSAVRVGDGVAITFTDITAHKQSERDIAERNAELERQKAFAERIIENVDTGICYLDRDLIYRVANPIYCEFLQMRREQIMDRYLFDVVPGGEDTILPIFRAALDEGRSHHVEALPFEYITPEGTRRQTYWDASYLPMKRPGSEEVEGVLVLANEVTGRIESERWQAESLASLRQIASQREFAERVLDNVPAGVAYLDRDLVYRFSNPVYAEFIDMTPDQIVGRYLDDVLPGAVEQTGPWLREVMATGQPFENESYRLTTYGPDGSERYTYWDFVYYPDEHDQDGQAKGVFVLANEISERLRAERERDEAQRERIKALEEGEKLKDQFLSILSHELRTPINAIMGFGSVLDDELAGPLNAEQRTYTSRILGGAETLLALINDLLDMSRIQAGKFSLDPRPIDPGVLIQEAVANLAPLAERRGHTVTVRLEEVPPVVVADPQRLTQVLVNLVGNAIKFTPDGGRIEVRACREGDRLRLEVIDTGIGIAPEDMPKLFRPFTQLETGNTRSGSGTGLGLSISKALVEAHHGEVGIASTPGTGSTFWFTVPVDGAAR